MRSWKCFRGVSRCPASLGLVTRRYFGTDGVRGIVGETLTLADLCLLPYTRMAPEGGIDLAAYGNIGPWIERASAALRV